MGTDFWLLESPLGSLGLPIKADKLNSPVGCCTEPEAPPGWPVGVAIPVVEFSMEGYKIRKVFG